MREGRGEREGEDDGKYVKRTCVRVSHQSVSQCVDVTLMQMGLRRDSSQYNNKKRQEEENKQKTEKLLQRKLNCHHFYPIAVSVLPVFAWTSSTLHWIHTHIHAGKSRGFPALLKGTFRVVARGQVCINSSDFQLSKPLITERTSQ